MSHCHRKLRYVSREFAQTVIDNLNKTDHRSRAARFHPYFCREHACWHIGHEASEVGPRRRVAEDVAATRDAIVRLEGLRQAQLLAYGQHADVQVWQGVRALSGAMQHLRRSLRLSSRPHA